MGFFDALGRMVQVPQAAFMGGLTSLLNTGERGKSTLPELLQERGQGFIDNRSDAQKRADDALKNSSNLITGAINGVKLGLRPSDFAAGSPGDDSLPGKLLNTFADTTIDPIILGGAASKGLVAADEAGPIATKLAKALSMGGKEDKLLSSGGALRALGRTYQGTLGTGNLATGFAAGQLGGVAEGALAKTGLGGAISRRIAQNNSPIQAAEEALGNTANTISDATELATQPAARFNGVPAGAQPRLPGITPGLQTGPVSLSISESPPYPGPMTGQFSMDLSPKALPVGSPEIPGIRGQQNFPPVNSPIPSQRPIMGELMPPAQGQMQFPDVQQSWQQDVASHPYEAQSSVPQIAMPQQMAFPGMGGEQAQVQVSPTDELVQKLMAILGNQQSPTANLARFIRPKVK